MTQLEIIRALTEDINKKRDELVGLESSVKTIKSDLQRMEADLDVLKRYLSPESQPNREQPVLFTPPPPKDKKKTFSNLVPTYFEDGIPKRSKDLLELFRIDKSEPYYKSKTFAPQLSQLKGVEKHEFDNQSQENKNWYGLSEWFENGKLKPEYLAKIKFDE